MIAVRLCFVVRRQGSLRDEFLYRDETMPAVPREGERVAVPLSRDGDDEPFEGVVDFITHRHVPGAGWRVEVDASACPDLDADDLRRLRETGFRFVGEPADSPVNSKAFA